MEAPPAATSEPAPRRSRFDPVIPSALSVQPVMPEITQEILQQTMVLQLQLQKVNERLITVVRDALEIEARPDRSPSPPPRYDSSGKRTNTREVRMRESLMKEKERLIKELMKVNPTYQAPADYVKSKPVKKIYLPKQTNPLYNYIGLIIGPRGNTQKQMEADTGCKISIRGKGAAKEGSKNRASKNVDDDDELHVHITAEDEESVEKAAAMIEELLKPQDDALNEHKQKQLRELALINGTLREDEYCPVCGEKGHRQFECPHRARSFKAAGVKCSICGDLSHPTRDCPLKQEGPTSEGILDSEYDSFMAELTGDGPASRGAGAGAGAGKGTSNGAGSGNADVGSAAGGANGNNRPQQSSNRSGGGPIYMAPIVDLVPTRKGPQTIIHVTTVMTGLAPPVFTSSMAPMGATSLSGHPSYSTLPSVPSLSNLNSIGVPIPAPAPVAAAAWNPYTPVYPGYGTAYPSYSPYAVPAPGAPALPAVPPPPPASAPAPPPATSATGGSSNQLHYAYPK